MNQDIQACSPTLSVIMPVLNAARTLRVAIDSVLQQSFVNFELVVLDGLSTDGTLGILKSVDDARLRWSSGRDGGVYEAMNKGIAEAKGEWLYFMGADDSLFAKDVFEKMFAVATTGNSRLIYGDIYSNKFRIRYDGRFDTNKLRFRNICHQSILYHRTLFQRLGSFDPRFRVCADWAFNIRCFQDATANPRYVDLVVANFEGGLSQQQSDLPFLRSFLFPANMKWLNENGLATLRSIRVYDGWWRLIRSLRLRGNDNLEQLADGVQVPAVIQRMNSLQQRISPGMLWRGSISKTLMTLSYLTNFSSLR